jgi:hypothetical protein
MRSRTAKRILEETSQETKEKVQKWAEEVIEHNKTEFEEQFKEQLIYGSLLYALDEHGNKVWLKRLTGDEKFEVRPVSVINGKIVTDVDKQQRK